MSRAIRMYSRIPSRLKRKFSLRRQPARIGTIRHACTHMHIYIHAARRWDFFAITLSLCSCTHIVPIFANRSFPFFLSLCTLCLPLSLALSGRVEQQLLSRWPKSRIDSRWHRKKERRIRKQNWNRPGFIANCVYRVCIYTYYIAESSNYELTLLAAQRVKKWKI